MDELRNLCEDITQYCIGNNIKIFHGSFSETNLTHVKWKDLYGLGWKEFLKQLNIRETYDVLIINPLEFFSDEFINTEDLETKTSNEVKTKILEVIEDLKFHEGHYYSVNVSLIKGSICYQFRKDASWTVHLQRLIDLKNELDDINYDIINNINSASWELSKEEINEFVEKILKNQDFLFSAHEYQRKAIIHEMFEGELNKEIINHFIINPAELALGKFFREKVSQLKKIGKTRGQICAELNMSVERVKRYY